MKKLSLLVLVAFFACNVHAQTAKGTIALTGTFGYSQQKGLADKDQNNILHDTERNNFCIAPSIGYFIKDNLELGVSARYYSDKSTELSSTAGYSYSGKSEIKQTDYRLYARQYKFLKEKLAVHGTLAAGMSRFDNSRSYIRRGTFYQIDQGDSNHQTFSASLSPGLTFFASSKVGLTLSFGALEYSRLKAEEMSEFGHDISQPQHSEYDYKSNVVELDFSSMNLNLSLNYFIGK